MKNFLLRCLLFLTALVALIVLGCLLVFLTDGGFLEILTGAKAVLYSHPDNQEMSSKELEALMSLIKNGSILFQDQLLRVITEFYNTIIIVLVVIITILAALAYLSIRSNSRQEAEDVAKEEVGKFFKEVGRDLEQDSNRVEMLHKEVEKLDREISFLQRNVKEIEFNLMNKEKDTNEGEL